MGYDNTSFRRICNPTAMRIRIFNPIYRKKTRFPESATRGAQVADSTSSSQRLGKVKSGTEYEPLKT